AHRDGPATALRRCSQRRRGAGRAGRAAPLDRVMTAVPPTTPPPRATERASSLVLVNPGDGRGKSTAAFGTVMLDIARGWKVAVVHFLKSGEWSVGEEKVARELRVDWWALGDGFTWDSENMDESRAIV